jgi:hypothetical protein
VSSVVIVVLGVSAAVLVLAALALFRVGARVDGRLQATDGELRRLADAGGWRERGQDDLRREVTAFRGALDQLRVREDERRVREGQSWDTLHRVAAVLSGGQRTGRAGENVLREALAHLPPSMIDTEFRVNGQVVEFALVLPDGRRLPIDSKWTADAELRALAETEDPAERDRLALVVERTVARRAREVAQYRSPSVTAPYSIAAVPDAAYRVLRRAHGEAFRQGVIVVPYSMALPVALFVHGLAGRLGGAGEVETCLAELSTILDGMVTTLENRVERAGVMLANGAQELRGQLGRARTTIATAASDPRIALGPKDEPRGSTLSVVGGND